MGEEYSWYAGLDQHQEEFVPGDLGKSATSPDSNSEFTSDAVIVDYIEMCKMNSTPIDNLGIDELPNQDISSDNIQDTELSSFASDSSREIALIQLPHEDTTPSDEEPEEHVDGEDDEHKSSQTNLSSLYIGGRVYSITSALVNALHRFVRDGVRYVVENGDSAVRHHKNALLSASRKEVNQLSRRNKDLQHFLTLHTLSSCLVESCYFAVDRTRTYTKWYRL